VLGSERTLSVKSSRAFAPCQNH